MTTKKTMINIEIEVKPSTILSIITTAHDSGVMLQFLDKRPKTLDCEWHDTMEKNPSKWSHFKWVLTYDEMTYIITKKKIVYALQKMIMESTVGKYHNKYYDPCRVVIGVDFGDAWFCCQVLQYAMFGKLIWG